MAPPRRLLAAVLAVLALCVNACGGARAASEGGRASPQAVLAETARNLGQVRSATVSFALLVESPSQPEKKVGFRLEGPVALDQGRDLPVARLRYQRLAGGRSQASTFLSTGDRAFVEVDGVTYELPRDQGARVTSGPGGPLASLDVGQWVLDPVVSEGERVDGHPTLVVTGDLDVVSAYRDLAQLASSLGAGSPPLGGQDVERLRRSVTASRVEVRTGADDRLLRRLFLTATLAPQPPTGSPASPPQTAAPSPTNSLLSSGVTITLDMTLTDLNQEVRVTAPAGARPLPPTGPR